MARYFEEREAGRLPNNAISTASTRIGRAFLSLGLTTVAGFGVLAFSGFPLLVRVDGQIGLARIDEPKSLPTPQR